ncbi:MAG TPA: carbohydrate-binding family 9-like protein [Anaerolineae bacterium]|nr:carbohydrate-binding family 9-like protein [Anaerolineae bacterium]
MMQNIPRWRVPHVPPHWNTQADPATWAWEEVPAVSPFILADGSGPARQQTVVRVCYDAQALYVRYDCDDDDIWGTWTQRDEPIYDEEVVEIFMGPGEADPVRYFEFQVSPNGVLLDARVHNPTSQRAELALDIPWNCPGIRWVAGRDDAAQHWWAVLAIPWAAVAPPGELPAVWRANFYRIERPHNAGPEFSCWSPTMTEPADFHKPAYFGILEMKKLE